MKLTNYSAIALIAMGCTMGSCIDDNYDLSDIDTTVQIQATDLVLSTKIDPIEMKSILEESEDLQIVNGEYAYRTNGTFESDDIAIDPFEVEKPNISSTTVTFAPNTSAARAAGDIVCDLQTAEMTNFEINVLDIDPNIVDISEIYGAPYFKMHIDASALQSATSEVFFNKLDLQLMQNLTITDVAPNGTYNPETGILTVNDLTVSTNDGADIIIFLEKINIAPGQFQNSELHLAYTVGIDGCELVVPAGKIHAGASLPSNFTFVLDYDLPKFDVNEVSGMINYSIDDFNIDPVEISDLPDVLNQNGTNLVIANPQIYISIDNPLYEYPLYAETDFNIVSYKDDREIGKYGLDDGLLKLCERVNNQPQQVFNYCLSPAGGENSDYPNAKQIKYTQLSNVLSDPTGNGIPNKLEINLSEPSVPTQSVERFQLKNYPPMSGKYDLVAPIQLGKDAKIIYADTITGWGSDDLDDLTIRTLAVSLTLASDIPLNVTFTGYPIDENKKQIDGVQIKGANITPSAEGVPVEISITGEIKNLDGIIFRAEATPSESNDQPLKPDMTLTITNLKAKASAVFQKEL